ncbi:hypothetical protein CsSME_00008966 [Camellia sinensis var. sinensis]
MVEKVVIVEKGCHEGVTKANCLISTPPLERVPIITHLSAYRKEKVISAIKYELDHRGQGIYVLPRIKGSKPTLM